MSGQQGVPYWSTPPQSMPALQTEKMLQDGDAQRRYVRKSDNLAKGNIFSLFDMHLPTAPFTSKAFKRISAKKCNHKPEAALPYVSNLHTLLVYTCARTGCRASYRGKKWPPLLQHLSIATISPNKKLTVRRCLKAAAAIGVVSNSSISCNLLLLTRLSYVIWVLWQEVEN